MTRNYDVDLLRKDLLEYMDKNGVTIRAFGRMTNISPSIISRIKTEDYKPGRKMIEKIRNIIGYRKEDVCGDFKDLSMDELNDLIDRAMKERDKRIQIINIKSEIEKLEAQIKEIEGSN